MGKLKVIFIYKVCIFIYKVYIFNIYIMNTQWEQTVLSEGSLRVIQIIEYKII